MDIEFTPDVQATLDQLSVETGRSREDFVSDAFAGYFEELAQVRGLLNNRYSDLKSGRVGLISSEQVRVHFHGKSAARPFVNKVCVSS